MSSMINLQSSLDNLPTMTTALPGDDVRPSPEANAQKAVAKAFETRNFDQVIQISTAALERIAASKRQEPEARTKLLWARASAYKSKKLPKLALADAKRALKLSPDDSEAYVRTATLLIDSDHYEQALECLNIADRKLKHCAPSKREQMALFVERQRKRLRAASNACDISRLPEEILLEVFQQIHSVNAVGLVCRTWRRILLNSPPIWRHLVLNQGLSKAQCIDALNAYTWRSNTSIEAVQMPTSLFWCNPRAILAILRKSAATLRHIKMPSYLQAVCHEELYSHCRNLKVLDLDFDQGTMTKAPEDLIEVRDEFPKKGASPFQLEVFKGTRFSYGFPPSDMKNLRVLWYRDPHEDQFATMRLFREVVELSETLEELCLIDPWPLARRIHAFRQPEANTQDSSQPITFKRLKALEGWNIPEHSKKFEFPALETATKISCYLLDDGGWPHRPASTFFKDSPLIRKLDLDLSGVVDEEVEPVLTAISQLQHLQDLSVKMSRHTPDQQAPRFEVVLAPKYQWDATSQKHLPHIPCLRLERLTVYQQDPSIRSLIRILAMRNYLALDHTFEAAQHLAQKHFGISVVANTPRTTPFHRGSATPAPPSSDEGMTFLHAAESERFSVCRLKSIELHLAHMPEGALEQLLELADQVKVVYSGL